MTTERKSVSIVVPVYNSAKTLEVLTGRIHGSINSCTYNYEMLLVNDGSADNSWQVITALSRANQNIVGINLMKNSGQHNALLCGIRHAKYPYTVTIDDDLQFFPEDIPLLLNKIDEGGDVVYGVPNDQKHGIWRTPASKLIKVAIRVLLGTEIARHISPFRVFKTKLRDVFKESNNDFSLIDVLLSWGTSKFDWVSVRHAPREIGKSNYDFPKLVMIAFNLITGFSTLPLRIATLLGLTCISGGILLLGYVFYAYLVNGGSVPGFPFLSSVIIIFSGAQLFALGIIGEYISRMYSKTLNRPAYIVESTTDSLDVASSKQESDTLNFSVDNLHDIETTIVKVDLAQELAVSAE